MADSMSPKVNLKSKSTFSPTQRNKGENTMSFEKALKEVAEGKKIHKLEWKDKGYYGVINDEKLKLHKPDGKFYNWMLSVGDILGDDFIVIE